MHLFRTFFLRLFLNVLIQRILLPLLFVAVSSHCAFSQNNSLPAVVNVDARKYGDPLYGLPTLNLHLDAGTYKITPVNPSIDGRAQFTAWDPWSPPTQAWDTQLEVHSQSGQVALSMGEDADYPSPQLAFNDPAYAPVTIVLKTADTLEFYVPDFNLGDNQGGLSVRIDAAPPPALRITNFSSQILVYWKNDYATPILETSSSLSAPNWTNAPPLNWTNAPFIGLLISNSPGTSKAFFRLR